MIRKLYVYFEEIVGSILLVATCVIVTLQVLSRYSAHVKGAVAFVFGRDPLSWTEEVGTFLFVYLVFIGASLALKKNEHFALEILTDSLPGKLRSAMRILIGLLVIVFSGLVLWFGMRLAIGGWVVKTPALEMPRTIPYAAVPLGGALMLVRSIEDVVRQIRGFGKPASAANAASSPSRKEQAT